jgi:lipopolysaccharide export LptBFGC system permease protein LptF
MTEESKIIILIFAVVLVIIILIYYIIFKLIPQCWAMLHVWWNERKLTIEARKTANIESAIKKNIEKKEMMKKNDEKERLILENKLIRAHSENEKDKIITALESVYKKDYEEIIYSERKD